MCYIKTKRERESHRDPSNDYSNYEYIHWYPMTSHLVTRRFLRSTVKKGSEFNFNISSSWGEKNYRKISVSLQCNSLLRRPGKIVFNIGVDDDDAFQALKLHELHIIIYYHTFVQLTLENCNKRKSKLLR